MNADEIVVGELYAVRGTTVSIRRLRATSVDRGRVTFETPNGHSAGYDRKLTADRVLRTWASHQQQKRAVPNASARLTAAARDADTEMQIRPLQQSGVIEVTLTPQAAERIAALLEADTAAHNGSALTAVLDL